MTYRILNSEEKEISLERCIFGGHEVEVLHFTKSNYEKDRKGDK